MSSLFMDRSGIDRLEAAAMRFRGVDHAFVFETKILPQSVIFYVVVGSRAPNKFDRDQIEREAGPGIKTRFLTRAQFNDFVREQITLLRRAERKIERYEQLAPEIAHADRTLVELELERSKG